MMKQFYAEAIPAAACTVVLVFGLFFCFLFIGWLRNGRQLRVAERERLMGEIVAECSKKTNISPDEIRMALRGRSAKSIKMRLEGMRMCSEALDRLKWDKDFQQLTLSGDIEVRGDAIISADRLYLDKDGYPK